MGSKEYRIQMSPFRTKKICRFVNVCNAMKRGVQGVGYLRFLTLLPLSLKRFFLEEIVSDFRLLRPRKSVKSAFFSSAEFRVSNWVHVQKKMGWMSWPAEEKQWDPISKVTLCFLLLSKQFQPPRRGIFHSAESFCRFTSPVRSKQRILVGFDILDLARFPDMPAEEKREKKAVLRDFSL